MDGWRFRCHVCGAFVTVILCHEPAISAHSLLHLLQLVYEVGEKTRVSGAISALSTGAKVPFDSSPISSYLLDNLNSEEAIAFLLRRLLPEACLVVVNSSFSSRLGRGKCDSVYRSTQLDLYILFPRLACTTEVSPLTSMNVFGPFHLLDLVRYTWTLLPGGRFRNCSDAAIHFGPVLCLSQNEEPMGDCSLSKSIIAASIVLARSRCVEDGLRRTGREMTPNTKSVGQRHLGTAVAFAKKTSMRRYSASVGCG